MPKLKTKQEKFAREYAAKQQANIDQRDAETIDAMLNALLNFDTTTARKIIKNPRGIKSLMNKESSLVCLYAMHALAVAMISENYTEILNEMTDENIAVLQECIHDSLNMKQPDAEKIHPAETERLDRRESGKIKMPDDTKRSMTQRENWENEMMLKSLAIYKLFVDDTVWPDAVKALQAWSNAIQTFERAPKKAKDVIPQPLSTKKEFGIKQEPGKTVSEKLLFTPISGFDLSVRTQHCLEKAGIEFICDLFRYSKTDFRKIHGLGPKGYHDVLLMLKKIGLDLDMKLSDESLQAIEAFKPDQGTIDNLKLDIHKANLLVRTKNCLLSAGIDTVGKLIQKTKDELRNIHGFGHKSMRDIECLLENMGLTLANPTPAQTKPDLSKIQIANLRSLKGAKNPLLAAGIDTVDKLIQMTDQDLRKIHGLGLMAIQHIDSTLQELGLELPKAAPVTKERHERKTMLDVKALESQLAALVELYKNAETDMTNAKLRRLAIQAQIGEQTDDDEKIEQLSTQLQTEIAAIKKSAAKMESLRHAKELSDKLTAAKNAKNNAQKALNAAESTLKSVNAEIAALLAHDWQM